MHSSATVYRFPDIADATESASGQTAFRTQSDGSREALASPAPQRRRAPDQIGRFALRGRVGAGAMGSVFRAFDPELQREVALKVLHARPGSARRRALDEGRALARIRHENVVSVYEVGAVGDDVFIAMELIDGQSLRRWLDAAPRSTEAVLRVFNEAARGLMAAHAQGLVHRDFKPDNVLITPAGRVVVVDFGLARRSADNVAAGGSMAATSFAGTPAYMSPEQHQLVRVDARSDQFSLALALWEALTGARPHAAADNAGYIRNVLAGNITQASAALPVSLELQRAINRALANRREHRFASMAGLVESIERERRGRQRTRRAARTIGTLVALSVVLSTAGAVTLFRGFGSSTSVALGMAALLAVSLASFKCLGTGALTSRWLLPIAHALMPGLLLSSWIADRGFEAGMASWFPPILAVAVMGTLIHPEPRRVYLQTTVCSLGLVMAWLPWWLLEGAEGPLFVQPVSIVMRVLCLAWLGSTFAGQARTLHAAELALAGSVADHAAAVAPAR